MARSQSPGDFQYFWQEYQDIESSKEHNGEEEEAAKTPDEGEQEAAWLKEAGYGFVVSQYIDGKELSEDDVHAMTESLPSNHAAVIRRRVDTLNATLRKKQKYTTKIDVRNIFPQPQPTATSNNGADSSKERQHVIRPSTLPHGMKLLTVGNDHSWIKQDKRDATDLDSAYSLFTKTEQRPIYLPQPQFNGYHLYTDLGGEGSESGSCNLQDDFSNVSYSRVREGEEGCVETKRPDELRYAGSGDQEPGSPCGSPLRSKSSSCNTLDSLDSGLDSYHSNKDQMSSQDSLDGISYYSFVYEVGHFTNLNEMQPAGHLIEGSSPKARHYSVLYEDNEPPLVGYRKRRKSNVKVR